MSQKGTKSKPKTQPKGEVKQKGKRSVAKKTNELTPKPKTTKPKSRTKKLSYLRELKFRHLSEFLTLLNLYCKRARYIVAKGDIETLRPHLSSNVQCIEKYDECDRHRRIEVFISFFHLESLFAHRQKLNMFFYNVARRMQLGGYIVGLTLDGQALLNHPDIECSELDHHQMMVGKKQKLCITFSTNFTLHGDTSLLVEWNSVEKLAHHYRFRLVQTIVEDYVRMFVYQLCVPLHITEGNTWSSESFPDAAPIES